MKIICKIALIMAICLLLGISSAFATNITIYDNRVDSMSSNSWYNSTNEDQEVEPNCIATQSWDLEAFYLKNYTLSMVGGFDFKNGVNSYKSGDIFIDTNGDVTWGTGSNSWMKYEYAIKLDFNTNTYYVYDIKTDGGTINKVEESLNEPESNPLSYTPQAGYKTSGSFTYGSISTSEFLGASHYIVDGIDLSFLGAGTTIIAHFTMDCGNDTLVGRGIVPEPATILLIGLGLLGLGVSSRKFKK